MEWRGGTDKRDRLFSEDVCVFCRPCRPYFGPQEQSVGGRLVHIKVLSSIFIFFKIHLIIHFQYTL